MTGGGGRRAQRWPEIWLDHRAELLHAAHRVWQACIPAMRSLSTDCTDYRAVDRLQAAFNAPCRRATVPAGPDQPR